MLPFLHRRYTTRLQVPQQLHVDHHRPFAPLLRFFPPPAHQLPAEVERIFSLPRRMDPGATADSSYSRIPFISSAWSSQSFFRRMRLSSTLQSTTATSHFSFISNSRRWCSSSSSSSSPTSDDASTTAVESQEQIGEKATAPKTTDTTTRTKKFELLELEAFDDNKTLAQVLSLQTIANVAFDARQHFSGIKVADFLRESSRFNWSREDLNRVVDDKQFDQYRQKLEARKQLLAIEQLITKESTSKLRAGQTKRHTRALAHGMRGRELPVGQLKASLTEIRAPVSTKEAPFIAVIGLARQGKTRFVDEIGYSHDSIVELSGEANFDPTSVFIFNVTFNSNWKIETDKEFSLQEAQNEVSLRLIAAAMGIFTAEDMRESGHASVVGAFLSLHNPSIGEVTAWLKPLVWKLYHPDDKWSNPNEPASSQGTWFFLFDELTELADRIRQGTNPLQTRESQKLEFYSALAGIIAPKCAVVGSGFTQIALPPGISKSGRPVMPCTLAPVVKSVQRRDILVMKTLYFQIMSMYSPSEAVLFYELAKSSPGVLGTILELLIVRKDCVAGTSLESLLQDRIPILQHLTQGTIDLMQKVMEWKSLQFCDSSVGESGIALSRLASNMNDDCKAAERERIACTEATRIAWIGESAKMLRFDDDGHEQQEQRQQENDSKTPKVRQEKVGVLSNVLIEPLFFFWHHLRNSATTDYSNFFLIFALMLRRYAECCSMMVSSQTQQNDQVAASVLSHFLPTNAAPPGSGSSSSSSKISVTHLSDLNGCFLEDAVAVGICAQKQLRLSCRQRNKPSSPITLASGERILSPSPVVSPLWQMFVESHPPSTIAKYLSPLISTSLDENVAPRSIVVEWISAESKVERGRQHQKQDEGRISLRHFRGQFPGTDKESQNQTPAYDLKHVVSSDYQAMNQEVEIANYFDAHTVLRPARPENNPLVDIIFHEKVANSSNDNSNDELIQFWVDTKHSHESFNPFSKRNSDVDADKFQTGIKRFANRVTIALNNPILASPSSTIKHIVHIIVSPFKPDDTTKTALADAVPSLKQRPKAGENHLASYTLYIVDPDSLCFENLVSHVIARSIPLMEQQHVESWSRRLPWSDNWWKFKAVVTGGPHFADACAQVNSLERSKQFAEWCRLRLADDCVSSFESLFESPAAALEVLAIRDEAAADPIPTQQQQQQQQQQKQNNNSVVIYNLPPASDFADDQALKAELLCFLRSSQRAGVTAKFYLNNIEWNKEENQGKLTPRSAIISGFSSSDDANRFAAVCNGRWATFGSPNNNNNNNNNSNNNNNNNNIVHDALRFRRLRCTRSAQTTRSTKGDPNDAHVQQFAKLPFGAVLEALGICKPTRLKERFSYNRDPNSEGQQLVVLTEQSPPRGGRVLSFFYQGKPLELHFDDFDFLEALFRSVTIGHLFQSDRVRLFDSILNSTVPTGAEMCKFVKDNKIIADEQNVNDANARVLFACSLWNMSVSEWQRIKCLSRDTKSLLVTYRSRLSNDQVEKIDAKATRFRDFLFSGKGTVWDSK